MFDVWTVYRIALSVNSSNSVSFVVVAVHSEQEQVSCD